MRNPILNIKFGFSTNSSSTHSLVFFNHEQLPSALRLDTVSSEFGWDHFTAASQEAKLRYLGATIADTLQRIGIPDEYVVAVAKSLLPGLEVGEDGIGYVDHQSRMEIPVGRKREYDERVTINHVYLDELRRWFIREGVAVLGGNDNEEASHPLDGVGRALRLPGRGIASHDLICRAENLGEDGFHNWTFFERKSGTRTRVQLSSAPFISSAPELIDIKLTNKCNKGCAYCYQGSTPTGLHATMEVMHSLRERLEEMEVFEIAFGGGEPLLHPEFADILNMFHHAGFVSNFTTRELGWLYDNSHDGRSFRKNILDSIGGFAYSLDDWQALEDLIEITNTLSINTSHDNAHKVNVQLILGVGLLTSEEMFKRTVDKVRDNNIGLTILGFKETGRGPAYIANPYRRRMMQECAWFVPAIKETGYHGIGVDTKIVQMFKRELDEAGMAEWSASVAEGEHSCYIDAVAGTMAASSWETTAPVPITVAQPVRNGARLEVVSSADLVRVFRGFRTSPIGETYNVRGFAE